MQKSQADRLLAILSQLHALHHAAEQIYSENPEVPHSREDSEFTMVMAEDHSDLCDKIEFEIHEVKHFSKKEGAA